MKHTNDTNGFGETEFVIISPIFFRVVRVFRDDLFLIYQFR